MLQENFVPITLPSKCLVYKDVDPSKIAIRTLKGKDEVLIAEMSIDNFDKKFTYLLKNLLVGIDPEKLTIGDKLFLALWLTVNSYGKIFPIEFDCMTCFQKSQYDIDLSRFEIKELPEGYKEPYEVKLSEGSIKLRLLNSGDIIKLNDLEKQGKNIHLLRYAYSVVDDTKNLFEKEEMLANLSAKDIMVIRAFHEKFYHGPVMEAPYECPKCGVTGIMPVPFRLEMLLPYGDVLRKFTGDAV